MFAARAVQSGNALAPKVTLAVSEMLTELMALVPVAGFEDLFDHMGFLRSFYSSLGYKLRAEALTAKDETGQAIGCANFASSVLVEQQTKPYNPLMPGIPKLKRIEEPFASGVTSLRADIKAVHDKATKDNNLIYFHPVPTSTSELAEPFQGMRYQYFIMCHEPS